MTTPKFTSRAPKMGIVSSFDGIRGIGVIMVLIQHAYNVSDSWSSIVDAFFVVSGFLITTLLIEEFQKTDTISLHKFYLRRATRLLPALLFVLIVGFILLALFAPQEARDAGFVSQAFWESVTAFFYTHNVFYTPLLGDVQYLGPMWTLSLEEQFYLFVAIATFAALKWGYVKTLFASLVGFYVFVNIARLTGSMGPGQFWFQRPDACAAGMIIAIINAWIPSELSPTQRKNLKIVGSIATATLLLSWFSASNILREKLGFGVEFLPELHGLEDIDSIADAKPLIADGVARLPDKMYWVRWGFTAGSLSLMVMVLALVRLRENWLVHRVLSDKRITYFGIASYALYISHYQVYILTGGLIPGGPKVAAVGKFVIAMVLGLLIHHYVERPMLKLKNRFAVLTPPKSDKEHAGSVPSGS